MKDYIVSSITNNFEIPQEVNAFTKYILSNLALLDRKLKKTHFQKKHKHLLSQITQKT
jgi:hypothetical protein